MEAVDLKSGANHEQPFPAGLVNSNDSEPSRRVRKSCAGEGAR
jgi:hypothetical protein